ncbi:MAG: hypothetical protein ABH833_01685 [Parcubacteria group bacterium]
MNKEKIIAISVLILAILVIIIFFDGETTEKSFATLGDAYNSGFQLECSVEVSDETSGLVELMTYYIADGNIRVEIEADDIKTHMLLLPAGFYMVDDESGEIVSYYEPDPSEESVMQSFLEEPFDETVKCIEKSISDSLFEVPEF